MENAIRSFFSQFDYEPMIENADALSATDKYIVVGMGGSHLAGGLLKVYKPDLDLIIHRDYGLPRVPEYFLRDALIIFSSYSGNTEEVLDSFNAALGRNLKVAVVTTGGELLRRAEEARVPFVRMPATGIQPRSALGYGVKALLVLMGEMEALVALKEFSAALQADSFEAQGKELAKKLEGAIPVIYSSTQNFHIGYNWKIKFNETGKIPAFCNVLPELNHNEMSGFGREDGTRELSDRFHFIFLRDAEDLGPLLKRMEVLAKLYADRALPVTTLELTGATVWHKIFSSLILADWTAFYTAQQYGLDPEQVPIIEEFKKVIGDR